MTEQLARREPLTITLQQLYDYSHDVQYRASYWKGRVPKDADYTEIERLLGVENHITPCLQRLVSGLLGKDFEWEISERGGEITGSSPEGGRFRELEAPMTRWHLEAGLHKALKKAFYDALWAGKSYLRLYIPSEYAREAQKGRVESLDAALDLIHIHALDTWQVEAKYDEHGRVMSYEYTYQVDGDTFVEEHQPQFVTLRRNGEVRARYTNPLYDPTQRRRRRFLIFDLKREYGSAITQTAITQQNHLNVDHTHMNRNSQFAGFRTVFVSNAEPVKNEDGEEVDWTLSADVALQLIGVELALDAKGEPTRRATPEVKVVDPLDPRVAHLPSIRERRAILWSEFDQLWTMNDSDYLTGIAREESRVGYIKRLEREQGPVKEAAAWALREALNLAGWLSGEDYSDLDFSITLFADIPRGSVEMFRANIEAYRENAVSLEALIESNPSISNVAQERQRIQANPPRATSENEPNVTPGDIQRGNQEGGAESVRE